MFLKKIYLLPKWLLELFSWGKSFKNNPIIGSYWLNRCGLHIARIVIAHGLFRFRLLLLSPLVPAEDRRQFRERGFVLRHNFLPDADFESLAQELHAYQGDVALRPDPQRDYTRAGTILGWLIPGERGGSQ